MTASPAAKIANRITRASQLASTYPSAASILSFYRELALFQKSVSEAVQSNAVTDTRALLQHFPALFDLVRRIGPAPIAEFGSEHLQNPAAQQALLAGYWENGPLDELTGSDAARFFARVLLQPYAEYLASRGDIALDRAEPTCPFCNARPVAAVLRGEGDGGKRWLLCSLCATEWQYRRVICPACGEEDKEKLPIYIASEFDYIRVDACDSCRAYIKSVDLTKNGHAIPIVDEIATVALNIWAVEHGYWKLEPNLLGM
jgi:FdhE protein